MRESYIRLVIFFIIIVIGFSFFVRKQMMSAQDEKFQQESDMLQQIEKINESENQSGSEGSDEANNGNQQNSPQTSEAENTDTNIEVYSKMALEYENMENYDKALAMYEKIYETENNFNTLERMLDLYLKLGYKDKLKEKIDDYTSKFPSEAERLEKYNEFLN